MLPRVVFLVPVAQGITLDCFESIFVLHNRHYVLELSSPKSVLLVPLSRLLRSCCSNLLSKFVIVFVPQFYFESALLFVACSCRVQQEKKKRVTATRVSSLIVVSQVVLFGVVNLSRFLVCSLLLVVA